jgi:Zn-dependent peptidase ImmA (M78 family)
MSSLIKLQASRDAAKLLRETEMNVIPIDPVAVARAAGLRVKEVPLDGNTMGMLIKETGQDPTIMINESDGKNRRRFTCAHELGHYVRRSDATGEFTTVDLRSDLSAQGVDEDEIYANEFAASLLMPDREVRRLLEEGRSDLEMAIRFGVSREAMQFRLKNLNLAT